MISAATLLRFEVALLLTIAFILMAMPAVTIKALGLPSAGSTFWPKLLGGVILGQAVATLAFDQGWIKAGLGSGFGGFVAMNLTTAFVLATLLVVGQPIPSTRGRILLWCVAGGLAVLGFVQIAYVS